MHHLVPSPGIPRRASMRTTGFRAVPILLGLAFFLASVPVLAQTGSISGQKFNDLNKNGIQDAGDPGLAGWTIQLDLGANGTVDATTVTGAGGTYTFTGLTAVRTASGRSARPDGSRPPSTRRTS